MSIRKYDLTAKHDALSYQAQALEEIKDLEFSAIFHEQGLGKTKIAVDLLLSWLERHVVDSVLVVTKKGLLSNWQREIGKHTHINPVILSEINYKNYRTIRSSAVLFLTHFELLKTDSELIELLATNREAGIILDEAQKIKNPDSQLTQSVLKLAPMFKRRTILTGTPIANRPYDIWSQIYFLDSGNSLGLSFKDFKSSHDFPKISDPSDPTPEDLDARSKFEENLEGLFSKIDSFSIRETKKSAGIKLPNKEFLVMLSNWEPRQKEMYERVRAEMRLSVIKNGRQIEDVSEELLKRLLRLVQIASNPGIIDESYEASPGKATITDDLVNNIISGGEKLIIWSAFTANVDWLANRYREYNAVRVHGKMAYSDRNRSIDSFLENEETKILVATPAAAKEGLTLTVANHVIFYDRSFSLDDYLQSQDRIHRISQEKTCYVYNIIQAGSIDEWVDSLIRLKSSAAGLAQGDLSREEYIELAKYDTENVLKNILDGNEGAE